MFENVQGGMCAQAYCLKHRQIWVAMQHCRSILLLFCSGQLNLTLAAKSTKLGQAPLGYCSVDFKTLFIYSIRFVARGLFLLWSGNRRKQSWGLTVLPLMIWAKLKPILKLSAVELENLMRQACSCVPAAERAAAVANGLEVARMAEGERTESK